MIQTASFKTFHSHNYYIENGLKTANHIDEDKGGFGILMTFKVINNLIFNVHSNEECKLKSISG